VPSVGARRPWPATAAVTVPMARLRVNLARVTSWILLGSAFSLLLYVGSNVAYTVNSQAELARAWDGAHPGGGSIAAKSLAITFSQPRLADGQPLARVKVPSIGFSGIVLEGTDGRILSAGPGHLKGSAYPGEPDNVVISNSDSFSLAWGNLKAGQDMLLDTDYGTFTYRVTGFKVVGADDHTITAPTGKPTLTFLTCHPLWAGSLAPQRYAVLAELAR
jgi:LPXTG-site transpeptidase (sortase) family protein